MKLGKLTSLLSAFNPSTPEIQQKTIENSVQGEAQKAAQTEAVRVSNNFGYEGADSAGETREQKVARLRDAVQSGSYKPDSVEVAKAVINDLFA